VRQSFFWWMTSAAMLLAAPAGAWQQAPEATQPTKQVLPLDQLVRDALQTNLGLRAARASSSAVETGIQSASGIFDPNLSASPLLGSGNRETLLDTGLLGSGTETTRGLNAGVNGTLRSSTIYGVSLDHARNDLDNPALAQLPQPNANTALTFSVRQPFLRGFGPTYAQAPVKTARYSATASRERLQRTAEQTIADVETFYWALGLAEAFEEINRNSLGRAQNLMDRNQKMADLKLIAEVDLITSQRGIQQRLTALTDSVRRRQDAAERLLFLVYGEQATSKLAPMMAMHADAPPGPPPAVPPAEEIEANVIEARSDVRAARTDRESADFTRRVAKNALLPDLALTGSYAARATGEGFAITGTDRVFDQSANDWRVGLAFGYPLWNRTARGAEARARYDAEVQALLQANTETNVRSEVRAATRALRTESERLEQSRLALEYANKQYAAGQEQIRLGLIDSFRLLQMEEDVSVSELVYQQTRFDLAQALTNYGLATGTLLEKYQATQLVDTARE
jgi:outer membrane protein TolC